MLASLFLNTGKKHSIADGLTVEGKANKMETSMKILPLSVENVILTHLLSAVKSTPLMRPHLPKPRQHWKLNFLSQKSFDGESLTCPETASVVRQLFHSNPWL